ncbi:MAG: hypothetical protein ABI186_11035 [Candidatus Elarobacter sp.]
MGADATPLYQPNDFIALEMGRVAAQRLTAGTISVFKASIERKRHQVGDGKYYRMWDKIVAGGADAIRQALVEPSERGQVLRSVISFRAFVTQQERDEIFRAHTQNVSAGRVR